MIRLRSLLGLLVAATLALWAGVASAARGAKVPSLRVPGGITQVTGKNLRVGQKIFRKRGPADPFVYVQKDGKVAVYGTIPSVPRNGRHSYLEFPSMDAFLEGGRYETRYLDLAPGLTGKEMAWDFLPHRWPDGTEVLYAGVMTPTGRRTKHAQWPADNWTRRVYAFTKDASGKWVMHPRALFNPVTRDTRPSMMGHAYGHQFKTVKVGGKTETWLFHEEVSGEIDTPQGKRLKTEIFARKMLDPFTASDDKVKILGVGEPPVFGRRDSGDHLVEGPRPFEARLNGETYHFVTFSGADFAGDGYDIHFAYRRGDAIGPYTPLVRKDASGKDTLVAYADRLKARYGLSWVGRAQVLQREDGGLWAVFHGVDKAVHPDADYSGKLPQKLSEFHRNVYVVPMKIAAAPDGTPRIELVDDPRVEAAPE